MIKKNNISWTANGKFASLLRMTILKTCRHYLLILCPMNMHTLHTESKADAFVPDAK